MYVNVSGFVGLVIVVGLVCIQYHAKETEEEWYDEKGWTVLPSPTARTVLEGAVANRILDACLKAQYH